MLSHDSLIPCLLNIGDTISSFRTTGMVTDAVVVGFSTTPCLSSRQLSAIQPKGFVLRQMIRFQSVIMSNARPSWLE